MMTDIYGQPVFTEDDVVDDILTRGIDDVGNQYHITEYTDSLIHSVNKAAGHDLLVKYSNKSTQSVEEYDKEQQSQWMIPDEYQELDIAEHVLSLCETEVELQRCGHELMMYLERDMFGILKVMKYIADTAKKYDIILGVGRGSSVSSYVLYKLGIHRVNSIYYDLDVAEFLR